MKNKVILKMMADPTRYKILKELTKQDRCACAFIPIVKKSQPNISLHLKKLQESGIVMSRKHGTSIIYSLKDNSVKKIIKLLEEN